ncbi:MAG: DUF3616 domain-containing protein [Pseudomonadota bacterium]
MAYADPAVQPIPWDVSPDFKGNAARCEAEEKQSHCQISGVACAGGGQAWCLAVNDEKNYAQLFSVTGRRLIPGKRIRLLEKDDWDEADAEGVAVGEGYIYIAGSHGLSRKKRKLEPSRFFVYRLPVDPDNGAPRFDVSGKSIAPEIERSDRLGALVRGMTSYRGGSENSLLDDGANFEGIGVMDGRLYAGFRAPVDARGTAVLEVSLSGLFDGQPMDATLHRLPLGAGHGIRGMARFGDGFLLLTGAAERGHLVPSIWFWRPGEAARQLDKLDIPAGWKAEAVMPLPSDAGDRVRVLVLFDGQANGAPMEFAIRRPGAG